MVQAASPFTRADVRGRVANFDGLLGANLTLPREVRDAIARRRVVAAYRLPAAPNPGHLVTPAAAEAGLAIAQAAGSSITIDTTGIAAARLAETELEDRVAVLAHAKAAADDRLIGAVRRHQGEVVTALQARHAKVAEAFVPAALRLPAGLPSELALRADQAVRSDWLLVADGVGEFAVLRGLLDQVADAGRHLPSPAVLAARWVRSDAARGSDTRPGAGSPTTGSTPSRAAASS